MSEVEWFEVETARTINGRMQVVSVTRYVVENGEVRVWGAVAESSAHGGCVFGRVSDEVAKGIKP